MFYSSFVTLTMLVPPIVSLFLCFSHQYLIHFTLHDTTASRVSLSGLDKERLDEDRNLYFARLNWIWKPGEGFSSSWTTVEPGTRASYSPCAGGGAAARQASFP